MKKGKHSKSRQEVIKERAKKDIKRRLIILVICLICIIAIINIKNENQQVSAKQENQNTYETKQMQEKEEQEEQQATEDKTTGESANENIENVEKLEESITPTESEEIKNLITQIKTEHNLTQDNFAFFYYNPQTQKYYFDNQDKYFKGASTIKVPVAMIYYDKIRNGELTKESTLKYTSDDYEAGGGTTASLYKIEQSIPISFLLEQSIVNSDNTAVNILIDGIGYRKCREGIAKYSNEQFTEEFYTTNLMTAHLGYDIINHIYQNQGNYEELIGFMKKSSNGEYLKKYVTEYEVAHKYGSYAGHVHDYGIVYSESPYLIGVFTQGVSEADELIANISRQVLDKTIENN